MRVINKLKIKEFSRLCGVTEKTLRHYEKLGLLMPAEVDEWTGYRYYNVEQMQTMGCIRRLKMLGFSLDEILDLKQSGCLTPSLALLQTKVEACRQELAMLQKRMTALQSLMDLQKKFTEMEKVTIESLPEIIVASHREVIPSYDALGPMLVQTVAPEMARLGCRCTADYCFTMEHHGYRPTDIDIEYCEQVDEMGTDSAIIQFKRLPAVPKAACMKHVGPYDRFHDSFVELFRYLEEQGLRVCGQPRTCYIDGIWNQQDPGKWLSLIQVPVE